jgi:hypothetical protein
VATLEEIRAKDGNLSIPLYVAAPATEAREERAGYEANGTACCAPGMARKLTTGADSVE